MKSNPAPTRPLPGRPGDSPAGWGVLGIVTLSAVLGLAGASWADGRRARRALSAGRAPRLRLDLNRASARELELLPGIGASRAVRLVKAREQRGGFRNLDELDERGLLGPGAAERLAPYLLPLSDAGTEREPALSLGRGRDG